MILETIRMVHAAMVDETTGVNAQLEKLDIYDEDWPPPLVARFLNEVDDDEAVLGSEIADWPSVTVIQAAPAQGLSEPRPGSLNAGTDLRDADVPLVITYRTKQGEASIARRDGLYTLRAIVRALDQLVINGASANNVDLVGKRSLFFGLSSGDTEDDRDAVVPAVIFVTFWVRDQQPTPE